MKIAIIGGTGVDELADFRSASLQTTQTRYGSADILKSDFHGRESLRCPPRPRAWGPAEPDQLPRTDRCPQETRRRASNRGICGRIAPARAPAGSFAVLGDFIDLTRHRPCTFFDEPDSPIVHTDFTHPYCPVVSRALADACAGEGDLHAGGCLCGPRWPTLRNTR